MARNGSGTYTTVNTFVAGDTITASSHNQNWADVAAEITNSVAADGQTTMSGPLKAASGTVAAPGIAFGSDPDTGIYRIGANSMGLAAAGANVATVSASGLDATTILQNGFRLTPIGLGPLQWSGRTAPAGWVLAGATYSRATYAALWAFAAVEIAAGSTFYGVGDGSTTFTIATMDGYVPVGTDTGGLRIVGITDVGDTAGASTKILATENLPAYTPVGGVSSTASLNAAALVRNYASSGASVGTQLSHGSNAGADNGTLNLTVSGTVTSTFVGSPQGGTSTAFSIVQPSRAFSYIIFAGA